MGGSHSKHDELIEKKKVVIVGFSFGGRNLLKSLLHIDPVGKRFEILILDKESHFEFICTNYFGLTEPEAFMKNAVPFETVMKSVKKNFV
jgi:NADH dehydrogenase FAD-containing subunit